MVITQNSDGSYSASARRSDGRLVIAEGISYSAARRSLSNMLMAFVMRGERHV